MSLPGELWQPVQARVDQSNCMLPGNLRLRPPQRSDIACMGVACFWTIPIRVLRYHIVSRMATMYQPPPMSPRREAWARPADMTPHDEQGVCSQPCSSYEAKEAKRLREATSVLRDTPYHLDFPVLEGQNAREIFPGVFSAHEETFKRQSGSEATFCDSSLLGIANPNEFRTETAQK